MNLNDGQALHREEVVDMLVGHLRNRDAYIISVHPEVMLGVMVRLARIEECVCYADRGDDAVMCCAGSDSLTLFTGILAVRDARDSVSVTFVIPTTIPPSMLSDMLGVKVDGGKKHNIVSIQHGSELAISTLLADALRQVDPDLASEIQGLSEEYERRKSS